MTDVRPTDRNPSVISPVTRKKCRVLIIEDNQDAADSLALLLELLGYEVTKAYNGREGLILAREWKPEVVLSDIGLPGIDGYEVAQELRKLASAKEIRLIAITGYSTEEDRSKAYRAGFNHYFIKPPDLAALQELLYDD